MTHAFSQELNLRVLPFLYEISLPSPAISNYFLSRRKRGRCEKVLHPLLVDSNSIRSSRPKCTDLNPDMGQSATSCPHWDSHYHNCSVSRCIPDRKKILYVSNLVEIEICSHARDILQEIGLADSHPGKGGHPVGTF